MTHIALYGNVPIERGTCPACEDTALIIDGCYACCDTPVSGSPERYKRISEPEFVRRAPGKAQQEAILAAQANCCAYCDRELGSWVNTGKGPTLLRIEWDHVMPFCHMANNSVNNFVAACHICNRWKHDLVFDSIDAVRVHCGLRWEAGDFSDVEERKSRAKKDPKPN